MVPSHRLRPLIAVLVNPKNAIRCYRHERGEGGSAIRAALRLGTQGGLRRSVRAPSIELAQPPRSKQLPALHSIRTECRCPFQTRYSPPGKDAPLQRAIRRSAAIVITPALCGLRHRDQRI